MRSRAELHPLADGGVIAKRNRRDCIAIDVGAQAGVRAHRKIPRLPDSARREHVARPLHFRAEELEERDSPRPEEISARRRAEEHRPHDIPHHAKNLTLQRVAILVVLEIKFCHIFNLHI